MGTPVKLLITYDIRHDQDDVYRRFVLEEFLPGAQALGLQPTDAWHTAYGSYPSRLLGLVADDLEALRTARSSSQWQDMVQKLEEYTEHLSQRVVTSRGAFQW